MNTTAPTKPVMDVALPKRPASSPVRAVRPKVATASIASSLARRKSQTQPVPPVQQAKITQEQPAATVQRSLPKQQQTTPAARQTASSAGQVQRGAPVALITAAVFVILIISALVITLYVTSQVA